MQVRFKCVKEPIFRKPSFLSSDASTQIVKNHLHRKYVNYKSMRSSIKSGKKLSEQIRVNDGAFAIYIG